MKEAIIQTVLKGKKPAAEKNQASRKEIAIPRPMERKNPPSAGLRALRQSRGLKKRAIKNRLMIQRITFDIPGSDDISKIRTEDNRPAADMMFVLPDKKVFLKLNLSTS